MSPHDGEWQKAEYTGILLSHLRPNFAIGYTASEMTESLVLRGRCVANAPPIVRDATWSQALNQDYVMY